jgi:hypothetical protein
MNQNPIVPGLEHGTTTLPLSLDGVSAPQPERVVTDWRRFSCGLWRVPEGDIAAA